MIGGWDESGAVSVIAPAAWANGNAPAEKTSGVLPYYGSYGPTITGATSGWGFQRDEKAYRADGVNDVLQYGVSFEHSDAGVEVFEFWITPRTIDSTFLCGHFDDGNQSAYCLLQSSGKLVLRYETGNVVDNTRTADTLSVDTLYHIVLVKDGGDTHIYINGVEAIYESHDTYSLGTYTTANNFSVADIPANSLPVHADIHWFAYYDQYTGQEGNHSLGYDMGLEGNNTGDDMVFTVKITDFNGDASEAAATLYHADALADKSRGITENAVASVSAIANVIANASSDESITASFSSFAQRVVFGLITPTSRTYIIPFEERIYYIKG